MKKLLFVDHGFHKKTRATAFLQELLAQSFRVETLWDEGWSGGLAPDAERLNAARADAILFFQCLPNARILRRLDCPNLTWAPMRDDLRYDSTRVERLRGSPVKILNFCREAHAYFDSFGQESLAVQYWPPPKPQRRRERAAPRIFFWPRRNEITWNTLKALLGDFRPDGIVLRCSSDPGHDVALPAEDDIRRFNITVVKGWLEHDAYLSYLDDCDIFMAPRPAEGIGQAMLEAMARGLSVIAPDRPTMNEYIQDGRSGWLYDPANPQPLDFSAWASRGAGAQSAVAQGHAAWLRQAQEVVQFVAGAPARPARWDWRLRRALRR